MAKPRLRTLGCVYDGGMKEVALFDYNQRAATEAKLAARRDKQKGTYFLQNGVPIDMPWGHGMTSVHREHWPPR